MSTLIAKTMAKIVTPIIILTSIAILLQGHNLPGGGFIGGVLTAAGFAVIYIMFSIDYLETKIFDRSCKDTVECFKHSIQEDYQNLFIIGLIVSVATGITALAYNLPFLTHDFWVFHWPVFTDFHIASAFGFDLGVYFVVVGSLLTILSVVGEE